MLINACPAAVDYVIIWMTSLNTDTAASLNKRESYLHVNDFVRVLIQFVYNLPVKKL